MDRLPLVPGVQHVDHIGLTVPDLDEAVGFFVDAFGAEELYRSTRGPDAAAMPLTFGVPPDAHLVLAMLRMPPNLNLELFEWSTDDRRCEHPRPSDAGGHHLCFSVADTDAAVDALRRIPGVEILGDVKQVGADSPTVAGNRWTYVRTPWGLHLELVDRSRVIDPPPFVGPRDWRQELSGTKH